MKSEKKERVESLYLLKAFSCFFVVAVHSSVYGEPIFSALFSVGTLCFLTITGYLLYSGGTPKELTKCTKWARKLFHLSLIVTAVYMVELLILLALFPCREAGLAYYSAFIKDWHAVTDAHGAWWEYGLVWLKSLAHSFVLGTAVCNTLWYLTAVWEALLILYVVLRYCPKLVYSFPLLFIFIYFLRSHPDFLFPANTQLALHVRLSILTALPFLSTGYLIHKHEAALHRICNAKIWLPIVLVLMLIETQIRAHVFETYDRYVFCTYPLVVLLIMACKQYSQFSLPFLNTIGEKHSANIYYFHMLILFILMACQIHIPFVEAVVVWLLCIPLSIIFNKVQAWCQQRLTAHKLAAHEVTTPQNSQA